jgi:tape measure domain-containing protein
MAATFHVNVVLRPRGVSQGINAMQRSLNQLGGTADAVGSKLSRALVLGGTAGAVTALVSKLAELSDSYTIITNKVNAVTASQAESEAVMDKLFEMADRMRTPIEATATSYQRLRNATAMMGLSQTQTLRITETLGKGLKVYGSTTAEAASTMLQFTQALNSGKLNGDEFRAVMENSPAVVKLLTDELKVSKGELAAMSKAGKITGKDMVQALLKGAKEIDGKFSELIPTISESFTVLRNNFIKSIGEMAASSGAAKAISAMLMFLAKNLDTVLKVVTSVGNAMMLVFAGKVMQAAYAGLRTLWALMLANPLTAFVLALVTIGSLLYKFDVQITSVGTGTIRFQKVVEVAWEKIKKAITSALKATGEVIRDVFTFFEEGFKEMEVGFGDILVFVGIFIDKFIQLVEFLAQTVVSVFVVMTAGIAGIIVEAFAFIIGKIEWVINKVVEGYNVIARKVPGIGTIGKVSLGSKTLQGAADSMLNAADASIKAAQDSYATLTSATFVGPIEKFMKELLQDSIEGAGKATKGVVNLNAAGKNTFNGLAAGGKKAADAFSQLMDTLYPATKALNDLRDAKVIVDKELAGGPTKNPMSLEEGRRNIAALNQQYASGAIAAGQFAVEVQKIADLMERKPQSRITDEEGLRILDRQRFVMMEAADAIEHYNYLAGQVQVNSNVLLANAYLLPEQFQAEVKAREKVNELIEKGIILSDYELNARDARGQSTAAERAWRDQQIAQVTAYTGVLENAAAAEAEATEINKRLAERIKDSIPVWDEYVKMADEINGALSAGSLTMDQATLAAGKLREEFGKKLETEAIKEHNDAIRKLREELVKLEGPFELLNIGMGALGEQFKSFVMDGTASFEDFRKAALSSLTDIILKVLQTRATLALMGSTIDPIAAAAAKNGAADPLSGLVGAAGGGANGSAVALSGSATALTGSATALTGGGAALTGSATALAGSATALVSGGAAVAGGGASLTAAAAALTAAAGSLAASAAAQTAAAGAAGVSSGASAAVSAAGAAARYAPQGGPRQTDGQSGDAPPAVSVNVFNQNDPGQMVPVMGSRAGRRQVFNTMRYAPRAVERLK